MLPPITGRDPGDESDRDERLAKVVKDIAIAYGMSLEEAAEKISLGIQAIRNAGRLQRELEILYDAARVPPKAPPA